MRDITVFTELPWLWAALAAYAVATFLACRGAYSTGGAVGAAVNRSHERPVLGFVVAGVGLLVITLWLRWVRIGHGPFVNLYELLISQLFSLGLIYALVYWRVPIIRPSAAVVLPIMWLLGVWVLFITPSDPPFPPTYHNQWLWVHVGVGKVFLSFCLIGTGLAGILLLRSLGPSARHWFRNMPSDEIVDHLAWRFMLAAFIFDSLMLVAGAVWAQDAWGRYWEWDALETSAFLTWLALGAGLHARFTYKIPLRIGALAIVLVFVCAFLTYFGTPFYSEAAHKGVI